MSSWIEVGKTGELAKGAMKEVLIKGQEILLVRVGDNYYASDNRCPHVTDGNVVQWLKGTGFFTTLGKMLKSPRPIRTYPVKLEDDRIMVQIPDKA
jgi:3-phenylpropionate/trans-cinnamate dioxygenase ferredoxin subunit